MKTRKMIMFTGAAIMAAGMMAGCGSNTKETTAAPTTAAATTAAETTKETAAEAEKTTEAAGAELSGSISMSGSTSMEKFGNALAESFMEKYPDVTVTVEFTGSSAGVEAALSGASDIGNSSRNLKDEEKSAGAVENIVAIDGIAVAVDPKNTVTDLTKDQLISIYTGEVKNWSDLGGENMPIVVVGREAGSGTRGAFIELFGIEEKNGDEKVDNTTDEAQITNSTSVMLTTVAGDDYAIGYVSLGALDDSVKAVKIDGAEATADNVKSGDYKVSRPFNIATKEGSESELAKDFISFILSKEGQAVVAENGYISDDNAEPFSGSNPSGKIVVGGSSSVSPLMEKLIEAYKENNPDAEIELQTTDSTTGMTSAIDGTYDIGMASRELKDTELSEGLKAQVIATDGIAVIVNKNSTIDELSSDQVKSIYTGETLTWDEVAK